MNWKHMLSAIPEDRLNLSDAYSRVFRTGNATDMDREIVFCDIMSVSGYFTITASEGSRSVGGHIFSMTNMSDNERDALYQASRQQLIEEQLQ